MAKIEDLQMIKKPGFCVSASGGVENKCKTCGHNMSNLEIKDDSYNPERYEKIDVDICRIKKPYWSQWVSAPWLVAA